MYRLNKCQFVGRLTQDPELKYSQDGAPIVTWSLAVPQGKDKAGQPLTDFFNFKAFGDLATRVSEQGSKGTEMFVIDSRATMRKYEKDGQNHVFHEYIVNNVQFGYVPQNTGGEAGESIAPPQAAVPVAAAPSKPAYQNTRGSRPPARDPYNGDEPF